MAIINRNRTIRTSSRLSTSKSYKIDTKKVLQDDTLLVNIDHESNDFSAVYKFNGTDVATRNSISFRVHDFGNKIDITWSGAIPVSEDSRQTTVKKKD